MPIDPACQPIANGITALEGQRDTIRTSLSGLAPLDRWKALAQIGDLGRQIETKREQLDQCQQQHAVFYEADVVLFDITNAPPAARAASLWQLDAAGPALLETIPLSGPGLAFTTPPPAGPVGLTIAETGNPQVQGLDFRSGPLEALPRNSPSDPAGRIEIVVGPTLTFSLEELRTWLSAVALPARTTTPITSGLISGQVDITVAGLDIGLATDTMRLSASGTASVTGALLGSQFAPFAIEVPLRFGLPLTPGADIGCNVVPAGSPSLTVGGQLGAILTPMAQLFFDFLGGLALGLFREQVNAALPGAIAQIFGLDDLADVPVVSLRRFEITPAAVTIQPTLGGFGTVLSTFQP